MGYFEDLHNQRSSGGKIGGGAYTPPPDSDSYTTDESGQVVDTTPAGARPSVFGGGDVNSAAAYGPDVLGGRPVSAPYTGPAANARVDASLTEPRTNPAVRDRYEQDYQTASGGGGGVPLADRSGVGLPAGPITTAVEGLPGITRTGNSYTGAGTGTTSAAPPHDFAAELRASNAADAANAQTARNTSLASTRAAQGRFDLGNAEQAAKVDAFFAANGADVTLGDRTSREEARQALGERAARSAGRVAQLQGAVTAADAAATPNRNYIDEFAKTQEELNRAKIATQTGATAGVDLDLKKQTLASQKQLQDLRTQLQNETDPAKQKILQNKLLAMEGKQPQQNKVAVVDVDTGQKDIMGQPIYKKTAVNTETGEMLGTAGAPAGGPTKTPVPEAIKHLQDHPELAAEFDAYYGPGSSAQYLKKK